MFPEIIEDMDVIPDEAIDEKEQSVEIGRTPLFDFKTGQYVIKDGKVVECTKEEAVCQWVGFLIKTAAGKFDVYKNSEFGTDIENYIGYKDVGFVISEIEREITEKITQNRAIEGLEHFDYKRNGDKLEIELTISMKDETEVVANVEI